MTDNVDPSMNSTLNSYMVAQSIRQHGGVGAGWIAEPSEAYAADHPNSGVAGAPLNAFEKIGESGLDVTFDTGEAFIGGSWLARDTETTVTLADDTAGQTVYLGWDYNATETVLLGLDSAFEAMDQRIPLYTFDTANGAVSAETDERVVGKSFSFSDAELAAGARIARFVLTGAGDETQGTPGDSAGELWRAGSNSSDLIMSVRGAGGDRMNLVWNAYYDGDWRYIVGNEPAYRLRFANGQTYIGAAAAGNADGTISWSWVAVDADGSLLNDDGDAIYDRASDAVPQGRLGGPASSLSDYPLAPGDLQTGHGSGLNADYLDGRHASEISTAGEWTPITTHTDTDLSTPVDFDTGTLSDTYDKYKVDLILESFGAYNDNFNEFACRVNNIGSNVYNYAVVDTYGDVEKHEGINRFRFMSRTTREHTAHAEYKFASDVTGTKANKRWANVSGDGSGAHEQGKLDHGHVDADIGTIDRFRFWTIEAATGVVQIQGKNY